MNCEHCGAELGYISCLIREDMSVDGKRHELCMDCYDDALSEYMK